MRYMVVLSGDDPDKEGDCAVSDSVENAVEMYARDFYVPSDASFDVYLVSEEPIKTVTVRHTVEIVNETDL